MADSPRLEELRRRVQQDPASIAFAALADEYRRAGRFHDAVETCRAGLTRHPSYLSARVTLGRALLEIGEFDQAEAELQTVLRAAPENLAAIRALADIHHRRGDVAETVAPAPESAPAAAPVPVSAPAAVPLKAAALPADKVSTAAATVVPFTPPAPPAPDIRPPHPALPRLERFLASILRAREGLGSDTAPARR
jgi:tetratricopeptide (TPR) repeat protein